MYRFKKFGEPYSEKQTVWKLDDENDLQDLFDEPKMPQYLTEADGKI